MTIGADKQAVKALVDRRAGLEEEMNIIIARLSAPGMPGIKGSVLDSEGFPRADIDVHAVRTDRHRLAVLKTDHTSLTASIEQELAKLFSSQQQQEPRAPAEPKRARLEVPTPAAPTPSAVGVIDEVSSSSPAEAAGLTVGDVVLSLGGVTNTGDRDACMRRVAQAVGASEGRSLEVVVMRQGQQLTVALVPQQWGGRGLLGCHMRPMQ